MSPDTLHCFPGAHAKIGSPWLLKPTIDDHSFCQLLLCSTISDIKPLKVVKLKLQPHGSPALVQSTTSAVPAALVTPTGCASSVSLLDHLLRPKPILSGISFRPSCSNLNSRTHRLAFPRKPVGQLHQFSLSGSAPEEPPTT